MHIDRSNGCATENKKENTVYVWWASGAVASIIMALTYTHIYSHKSIDNHSSHEITSMKVVQLPIHLFSALNYVSPFCFIKHTDFLLHFVSSGIFVERRKKHHQTADCDHCIVRRVFLPRLIPIMWSKNKVFRTQYNWPSACYLCGYVLYCSRSNYFDVLILTNDHREKKSRQMCESISQ